MLELWQENEPTSWVYRTEYSNRVNDINHGRYAYSDHG